ncbi:MAG TPA: hypothetical protein VJ385_15140 [Fibrobacteria bacterium]|nr:hypothetical protein [Fibrobacteria bacterium]
MMTRTWGAISLWAASMAWAGSGIPAAAPAKPALSAPAKTLKPKAAPLPQGGAGGNPAAPGNLQGTVAPSSAPKAEAARSAPKPILAEAFIAQTVLRVYLDRPAAIFVYNSRGQQVFHLDSRRPMEAVPLQGLSTGFVYLTVRTAQGEVTKKLVYTGK